MQVTFEPKGDVAEWRVVYDHIKTLKIGETVTYDDLTRVLGRDFLQSRGPFHKANRRLLNDERRGLLNVKNVGYRVVSAVEHEGAARSQHKFARRRLRRAHDWLSNTDRNDLPPEVVERFDRLEESVGRQIDFTRRLDGRVARVEKALVESRKEQEAQSADTSAKLSKLIDTLERHGINLD